MESNSDTDLEDPSAQTTNANDLSPSPADASTAVSSILPNAHHNKIHGNTFVISVKDPSLNILHGRVAMNAILNAGAVEDGAICHPGTRKIVNTFIKEWRDAPVPDGSNAPILWLRGPAGAGKTAIVRTIAQLCIEQKIPQANFFFSREDTSRNTTSPLLATLLYQVIRHYPSVRKEIAAIFSYDPLVLDSDLRDQLKRLITTPLLAIHQPHQPLILLIDGLDECNSGRSENESLEMPRMLDQAARYQRAVVCALGESLSVQPCPFRVLVASRNEPQLSMAFKQLSLEPVCLDLDQRFSPVEDIRVFVTAQFESIKKTHHLADTLDKLNWPSKKDIDFIVEKSSGQFLYAATVMRFILYSPESPADNLEKVLGAENDATSSCIFSQMDAAYHHILRQANYQDKLKDILHAHLLKQESNMHPDRFPDLLQYATFQEILRVYNPDYTERVIGSCMVYLNAIARYTPGGELAFYHASFSDYLFDATRSKEYFVDINVFHLKVLRKIQESFRKMGVHVATNAIINRGGRADIARCHPGTRKEVIGRIEEWRVGAQKDATDRGIFWLSGFAGGGKTAIMQTIAESWRLRGIHVASFFFFRTDPTRNHANYLVSTLLYQIFDFHPAARQKYEKIIVSQAEILTASLKEQFNTLVCSSLRSIGVSFSQPVVLLIDGLDECIEEDSQKQVLHALDALVSRTDLPFMVLIASRGKDQITSVFKELHSTITSILLDDAYLPLKDIRLFVTAEFDRIKRTHPLAPQDKDWPLASDIDEIVTKSSEQFIFPSTIMRIISQSPADPKLSLAQLLGITAGINGTGLPFLPLDSIYTHILRQARDQKALSDILRVALVLSKPINKTVKGMLFRVLHTYNRRYTENVIQASISEVMSVVQLRRRELVFQHASFNDYLQDRSRSGEYFVDLAAFGRKILPAIWLNIGKTQGVQFGIEFNAMDKVESMLYEFMNTVTELEPADFRTFSNVKEMENVFKIVYELCVKNNDVANYNRMIRNWTTHYISLISSDSQVQALDGIPCSEKYIVMAQIDREQNAMEPTPAMAKALRPSSHFDACELTLWIGHLLRRIHTNYHSRDLSRYKQLMEKWILLAVLNKIPLRRLDTLPHAQQYFWNSKATKSKNILSKSAIRTMVLYHKL